MAARRRSTRAHDAILEAALELFAARGLDASMDAIAERAGVSKATIYSHWADKDALCLEALARLHGLDEPPPIFDSGDTRADLIAALNYRPAEHRRAAQRAIMPHFIAHSARNRQFGHAWRARVMEPIRTRVSTLLSRAMHDGELPENIRLDVAVAMLIGPLLYREIFTGAQSFPTDLTDVVVTAFWRSFGGTSAARRGARQAASRPAARRTAAHRSSSRS